MAYGNWGAWVYRDGVHMPRWEDASPYRELAMAPGYQQAFMRDVDGIKSDPHHAVLGSGLVRLCGYKNYPVLLVAGEQELLDPFKTCTPQPMPEWVASSSRLSRQRAGNTDPIDRSPSHTWCDACEWQGQVEAGGEAWLFAAQQDGDSRNMIDLWLRCPDGTEWRSRCGYEFGAGFEGKPYDFPGAPPWQEVTP